MVPVLAHAQGAGQPAPQVRPTAVPDWPIGARADRDVITPIELVVQDPEETQLLQERAAARVSLIYRLDLSAPADATKKLERSFFEAQEQFRREASAQFGRYPVSDFAFQGDRFTKFTTTWLSRWNGFPPSIELAKAWAQGDSGREHLAPITELLAQFQTDRRIRESTVEPDSGLGPADVLLLAVDQPRKAITRADVEAAAAAVSRGEFIPLSRARMEMQALVPGADSQLGKFVASFVQANVIYDEPLTREERRAKIGSISSLDRYRAGQAIVRSGDIVTPAVKAALDQLRSVAPEGVAVVETLPLPAGQTTVIMRESSPWYGGAGTLIGVSVLILALAILFLARRVQQTHQVVQHSTALALMQGERTGGQADNPERARIVERALRDAAVQSLYGQRQQLVHQNQQAADRLADLEARVSRLQPQIKAKLRAYEDRIAELEGELAFVRAESRERLREQIEDTRRERDEFIADLA